MICGGGNGTALKTEFPKDQGQTLCSGSRVIALIIEKSLSFFSFFLSEVREFKGKDERSAVLEEKHPREGSQMVAITVVVFQGNYVIRKLSYLTATFARFVIYCSRQVDECVSCSLSACPNSTLLRRTKTGPCGS